jgi:hypothetical protein
MKFSNAKLRIWLRAVHLVGLVPLGLVTYADPDQAGLLPLVVQVVVFPGFVATGLLMWQMPRLSKWLKRWS